MDQKTRLRDVALELSDRQSELLTFVTQSSLVANRPDVSNEDKRALQAASRTLVALYTKLADIDDSELTPNEQIEQLIASHDRFREELSKANVLLERILSKPWIPRHSWRDSNWYAIPVGLTYMFGPFVIVWLTGGWLLTRNAETYHEVLRAVFIAFIISALVPGVGWWFWITRTPRHKR